LIRATQSNRFYNTSLCEQLGEFQAREDNTMRRTRNLLAKVFCFERQTHWDSIDGLPLLINPITLKTLQSELLHRPPIELQQAEQELGIDLVLAGLHAC
jgi:hypothetical protein